jgi:hypothetical protein
MRWFTLVVRSVLRVGAAVVALVLNDAAYFYSVVAGVWWTLIWTVIAAFAWFGVGLIGPTSGGRSRLRTAARSLVADLRTGLGWVTTGALGWVTFLGIVVSGMDTTFWDNAVPFLSLVEVVCLGVLAAMLLASGSVERPGWVALSGLGGGFFLGLLVYSMVWPASGLTVLAWSLAGLLVGLLACTRAADRLRQRVGSDLYHLISRVRTRTWVPGPTST